LNEKSINHGNNIGNFSPRALPNKQSRGNLIRGNNHVEIQSFLYQFSQSNF